MKYPDREPTMEDVQRACGLGRTKTREAVLRGELPAKKIGGKYVTRWEWIDAWINGQPGFWHDPVKPTPIFRTPGPISLKRQSA